MLVDDSVFVAPPEGGFTMVVFFSDFVVPPAGDGFTMVVLFSVLASLAQIAPTFIALCC